MILVARFLVTAILALVVSAAQVPSEPPAPSPSEANNDQQSSPSDQSTNTDGLDSLEEVETGPEPATGEQVTQPQAPPELKQPGNVNQHSASYGSISTWMVTVFTAALTLVAILQFLLSRQVFRSTHRPKLRVRNVVIPDLVARFSKSTSLKKQHEWACDVVNIGGTPATLTFFNIHLDAMHDPGTEETIYSQPQNQITEKIEIAGGESRRMSIPYTAFTDQDWARVSSHGKDHGLSDATDLDAYVVGVLKYKDKVGLERQTSICRKFDRKELRFLPGPDPDYEYED